MINDDTEERLENLNLTRDFVIVRPNHNNWYRLLSIVATLISRGHSVALLERYSADISTIPESKMNELGWFRYDD